MNVGAYMERLEAVITEDERITIVQILLNRLSTKSGKIDCFHQQKKEEILEKPL
jgi:hypothetical protein